MSHRPMRKKPTGDENDRMEMHMEAAAREFGPYTWIEAVERIRHEHNGVMRVDLYFGHDGDNVCRFSSYDKQVAKGESGRSMQEAVDRCIAEWQLERTCVRETRYETEPWAEWFRANAE